jgi:hypothetical protein
MTREQLLQQQASARVLQERYDNALQPWGARADAKPLAQDLDGYWRDHLMRIKELLPEDHELRSIPIRKLPLDALNTLEPQILAAASDSAWRADAVPQGRIERRESIDGNGLKSSNRTGGSPATGSRTRPHAFAHGMSRPSAVRRTSPKWP